MASWYSSKLFEVKNLTPFPVAIFWDILAKRRQFSEQVLSPMNGHILINISCSGVEEAKFCQKKDGKSQKQNCPPRPYSKAQCRLFKQNPANKFRFDTKFEQIK